VQFARVDRVPTPGEIVQASEAWEEAAGGGGVTVVQLGRAAGTATFYTALGDDQYGRRAYEHLTSLGVRVEAAFRSEPQRRAFTFVDRAGERTITLIGSKARPRRDESLPWSELSGYDAVYFCAGDAEALRAARAARVLVATARELPTLQAGGVVLDALVASARDSSERYAGGELDPPPRLVVRTEGVAGGTYEPGGGRWRAALPPGPVRDAYGAGDSFAAGLAFALAEGRGRDEAVAVAAQWGAAALTRRGAHGEPAAEGG
jgi:ribokinase